MLIISKSKRNRGKNTLTYFDDNRYTITMAKTPSDGRAGKNNVSEINKKLF